MKRISFWTLVFGMCLFCVPRAQAQDPGFIPVFDDLGNLVNSVIFQDINGNITITGGRVGIGTTNPLRQLDVQTSNNAIFGQCTGTSCEAVTGIASVESGIAVSGIASMNIGVRAASDTGLPLFAVLSSTTCTVTGLHCNIFVGQTGGFNVVRIDPSGKGFFNGGTQTGGADFAESVELGQKGAYEPGDVLVIDPSKRRAVSMAAEPYSTLVAGIYSTKPGVLASPHHVDDPRLATEIPLAILGIVPCKVSAENGAIKAGDLLVTSSTPGHAMKGTDRSRMLGAVVGKALEPLASGKGVIQVLVTLQ